MNLSLILESNIAGVQIVWIGNNRLSRFKNVLELFDINTCLNETPDYNPQLHLHPIQPYLRLFKWRFDRHRVFIEAITSIVVNYSLGASERG
jgi:hypothetical protein